MAEPLSLSKEQRIQSRGEKGRKLEEEGTGLLYVGSRTRCNADKGVGKLQAMCREPTCIRKLLRAVQIDETN